MVLVSSAEDHHAVGSQLVLHADDLARTVGAQHLDHVQRFVEHHLGSGHDLRDVDVRRRQHPHLAPGGHDVERAVLVAAEEHTERGRRLAELLDLLGERLDLVALRPERVGELLVLAHRLRELLAGLDELLLEDRDLAGRVREAAAEQADLFLEELDLRLQLVDVLIVALDLLATLAVAGHSRHLPATRAGVYTGGATPPRKLRLGFVPFPYLRHAPANGLGPHGEMIRTAQASRRAMVRKPVWPIMR